MHASNERITVEVEKLRQEAQKLHAEGTKLLKEERLAGSLLFWATQPAARSCRGPHPLGSRASAAAGSTSEPSPCLGEHRTDHVAIGSARHDAQVDLSV
jgi:hypothetical protein